VSGVLDRQEVIAVLDLQQVGAAVPPNLLLSYRETLADALVKVAEPIAVFAQVRCTDMEDYARIYNEGFSEAQRQCEADVRTAGAEALKTAAAEQRRLAEEARTNNGHAEHEDIADWLEERADEIPGRVLHCPVGCDEGACESCPCCSAGFCVYGLDGLPDDPEQLSDWLEVAAVHNPVAALLKAQSKAPAASDEAAAFARGAAAEHQAGHLGFPLRGCTECRPIERRPVVSALPEHLQGDGPCTRCGTEDNIVWFTDSTIWNAVVRADPGAMDEILCIPCFVIAADKRGVEPTGWRLIPEFPVRYRVSSCDQCGWVGHGECPRGPGDHS
jgi:hypothetical protein